jgi:two-component system cell cycle response regulator
MKKAARILVVDDDAAIALMLTRALGRRGYDVVATHSPEEAITQFSGSPCDAAVLDLVMPERDGMDLANTLRAQSPGIPIAILTGYAHSPLLPTESRTAFAVFVKPVVIQEVVDFLDSELGRSSS